MIMGYVCGAVAGFLVGWWCDGDPKKLVVGMVALTLAIISGVLV